MVLFVCSLSAENSQTWKWQRWLRAAHFMHQIKPRRCWTSRRQASSLSSTCFLNSRRFSGFVLTMSSRLLCVRSHFKAFNHVLQKKQIPPPIKAHKDFFYTRFWSQESCKRDVWWFIKLRFTVSVRLISEHENMEGKSLRQRSSAHWASETFDSDRSWPWFYFIGDLSARGRRWQLTFYYMWCLSHARGDLTRVFYMMSCGFMFSF